MLAFLIITDLLMLIYSRHAILGVFLPFNYVGESLLIVIFMIINFMHKYIKYARDTNLISAQSFYYYGCTNFM